MKINDKELAALYGSYLSGRIPPSRKDCPSAEELLATFHAKAGIKQKTKVIDHLSQCAYCAREFTLALEIERGKKRFVAELGDALFEREHASKKNRLLGNIFVSYGFWQYAAMALGIVFLSASFLTLIHKTSPFSARFSSSRLSRQFQIQLVEPKHMAVAKARLIFKWKPIASAEYYVLELYDEAFALVWKSPETTDNRLVLPQGSLDKLPSFRTYFWMLTAHTTSGKDLESSLADFRLLD